jgi:hypothetical protein
MRKTGVPARTDNFHAMKAFSSSTKFSGIDFKKVKRRHGKENERGPNGFPTLQIASMVSRRIGRKFVAITEC